MKYDPQSIESRWQTYWAQRRTFRAPNPGEVDFDPRKPKYYVLDMFPYPSGVGLHVGHPLGYIATDIVARYKRHRGFNVLHPMGYDAFGLPAEQFAVEHGVHPAVTTQKNIDNMTRQLKRLGLSYDWDRAISTTDVEYYRWTQWIFLQLYNAWFDPRQNRARPIAELVEQLEKEELCIGPDDELVPVDIPGATPITGEPIGSRRWGALTQEQREDFLAGLRLAYLDEVPVNWCPALGTVLANEEVTNDGRSERGNHPVFKRPLKQWMLRITAYAPRLLSELEQVDWPEPVKIMQRNWIGPSTGALVTFTLAHDPDQTIEVFTTRPDTLFGATYMVLAPEHPLVEEITTPDQYHAVNEYRLKAQKLNEQQRTADAKEKTGVFTGAYALNPVNGQRIPVWIADYVLMGYGTGAIMAVPAHDQRDFEFACAMQLPIVDVVHTPALAAISAFVGIIDREKPAADQQQDLLVDFMGLAINQNRTDYDEVYRTIATRRGRGGENPGISSRGSISMIWREALPSIAGNDLPTLFEAARQRRLVQLQGAAMTEQGVAAYSANDEVSLNGLPTEQAKARITDWLLQKGLGKPRTQYKLRDWLFSRQRYWGEPFPILHRPDGGIVALDETQLPVELPAMDDFRPSASDNPDAPPQPPLSRAPGSWKQVHLHGQTLTREFNTMPQWAGSCWYYLRFLDPRNGQRFVGGEAEKYWMLSPKRSGGHHAGGVDLYVGGVEHAVLHLLYARFWHKVLFDLGYLSTPEPFGRLYNQGYIQAYCYRDARGIAVPATEVVEKDGRFFHQDQPVTRELGKMGKSLKNAIAPDEVCEEYGCDTLRLYEMYMGPLDQSKVWNTQDILGVHRFLQRVWRNFVNVETNALRVSDEAPGEALRRLLHKTIQRVSDDLERLSFNTAIAALIELNNELVALPTLPREVASAMTLLLSPLTPHLAEELWSRLGHTASIAYEPWPAYDPALLTAATVEYPVQVNGKVRDRVTVPADADEAAIQAAALALERVQAALAGKPVKKVLIVKGRLVNIVV